MIRKIKAEDKEFYIKMAHDFYRMPAVDHPVPDSYLEKTFEECMKRYLCGAFYPGMGR